MKKSKTTKSAKGRQTSTKSAASNSVKAPPRHGGSAPSQSRNEEGRKDSGHQDHEGATLSKRPNSWNGAGSGRAQSYKEREEENRNK